MDGKATSQAQSARDPIDHENHWWDGWIASCGYAYCTCGPAGGFQQESAAAENQGGGRME